MPDKPYEKSFASVIDRLTSENALKLQWSSKNGDVQPKDISKSTGKKYHFECLNANCEHEVITSPDKINQGCGCPYCCIPAQNYVVMIIVIIVMKNHLLVIHELIRG